MYRIPLLHKDMLNRVFKVSFWLNSFKITKTQSLVQVPALAIYVYIDTVLEVNIHHSSIPCYSTANHSFPPHNLVVFTANAFHKQFRPYMEDCKYNLQACINYQQFIKSWMTCSKDKSTNLSDICLNCSDI